MSGTALRSNKIRTYKRRCTKSSTITVHSSKNQKFFLPSTNSFPRARPGKSIHKIGEIPSLFRSEEHTSELQSLMRSSYAVFCLKIKQSYISNSHTLRLDSTDNTLL